MSTMLLDSIINGPDIPAPRPHIVCADGFTVSVQASKYHYCSPRSKWDGRPEDWSGPYTHVEVGFPSEIPEPWQKWLEYCESDYKPTETVYARVPVEMVRDLIAFHGGEA